jgi:hypothetical protein
LFPRVWPKLKFAGLIECAKRKEISAVQMHGTEQNMIQDPIKIFNSDHGIFTAYNRSYLGILQ